MLNIKGKSMIEIRKGNALTVKSGLIVHGCNSHGVMGAGIALAIKNEYPEAFDVYKREYDTYGLKLGTFTHAEVGPNKFIINAITQGDFGIGKRQVDYEAIAKCFEKLVLFRKQNLSDLDIVFPKIGAGLGGGNWNIIEKIIDETVPDTIKKILYVYP